MFKCAVLELLHLLHWVVVLSFMCSLPHGRAVKVDQEPLVRVEVERICKLEEKKANRFRLYWELFTLSFVGERELGWNLWRSQTKAGEGHLKCKRATSCPQLAEHNGGNPFAARVASQGDAHSPPNLLSSLPPSFTISFSLPPQMQ